MRNTSIEDNRLEVLMEKRNRILSEAKATVGETIKQVIDNLDVSHGIKVFQTRHIVEALALQEGWSSLGIGEQTLLDIIRECGYESVSWKTPQPGSRIVKVWRKVQVDVTGGVVWTGE